MRGEAELVSVGESIEGEAVEGEAGVLDVTGSWRVSSRITFLAPLEPFPANRPHRIIFDAKGFTKESSKSHLFPTRFNFDTIQSWHLT